MAGRRRRRHAGDPDLVECLYCGDRMRSLGPHLHRAHGVTAAEYRAEHRLPASYPLMAPSMRAEQSTQRKAAMEVDPSIAACLIPGVHSSNLARSAESRAATDSLPRVRDARRRGVSAANAASVAARAAESDRRARLAGYESVADAALQTADLPERAAAERIGIARSTLRRWRAKT